jgi:hypothetical protein
MWRKWTVTEMFPWQGEGGVVENIHNGGFVYSEIKPTFVRWLIYDEK